MKNLITIFMLVIVISNILDKTAAAKRIKRESAEKQNHTMIAEDFVVLQPGKNNNLRNATINSSHSAAEEKSNVSQYLKNPIIHKPLAYIIQNKEQHLFTNNKDPQLVALKNVNNRMATIETGTEPQYNRNRNEKAASPPLNTSAASNADDAFVYHSMSPFAPLDQMMRFANMLLYKKERDDASSINLNSLSDTDMNSFGSSGHRPYFVATPIALAQTSAKSEGLQQPALSSISRIPIKALANERPSGIMDLFEKAFLSPIDHEVEIFCPLHTDDENLHHNNYHYSKDDDDDVIQVCSCHLIKSHPDNLNKEHK